MRREDYQPPKTPADSPFRQFRVQYLKCQSYKLRVIGEFDGEAGEVRVFLFCPSCRSRELMLKRSQRSIPSRIAGHIHQAGATALAPRQSHLC